MQIGRQRRKMFIVRPEPSSFSQRDRREEVRVDVTDTAPHEPAFFDKEQHFFVAGDSCLRQIGQQVQHFPPLPERAARELADDKWMGEDFSQMERLAKGR